MQRRSRLEIESGGVWVRVPNQNCLSVPLPTERDTRDYGYTQSQSLPFRARPLCALRALERHIAAGRLSLKTPVTNDGGLGRDGRDNTAAGLEVRPELEVRLGLVLVDGGG